MGVLFTSLAAQVPDYYNQKSEREREIGRSLSNKEFEENYLEIGDGSTLSDTGTSIFDPVLCEINYAWFTAENDSILDPFAGGSVRGIVASKMNRNYTGIELRTEQVEANREQAAEICRTYVPEWICGDSLMLDDHVGEEVYDHILTCPPYGNLEVYSDMEEDISNMSDDEFDATYTSIIKLAASHLKEDRFATFVVGNYRDSKGHLRDLVGLTVRAMEESGCHYYNDFIFITPVGSLPIRIGRQFKAGRKMGRTHQYMLTFVKGDWKKATERLGDVQIPEITE